MAEEVVEFKPTLRFQREWIIQKIKDHQKFFLVNAEKLDIYEGNLLPYIDKIMQLTLAPQYYNAIKERILPVNVLQKYVDKVSIAYVKGPKRETKDKVAQEFLDYFTKALDINTSGMVADSYSAMFKGFAWEPYITAQGIPKLRELAYDRFLVLSDSKINPEEGNIFVKIIGNPCDEKGNCLVFTYTDNEFDSFYMDNTDAPEYRAINGGLNQVGTIPFVYGKRQKNKLIPTQDSDILAFSKSIPVMLSDAAGAQMFQCFTVMYGIDVNFDDIKLSPNAIWNLKSEVGSDKEPQVGTLNPSADTDKVVKFIVTCFVLWLETKGIRVGSIGAIDAGNLASGISKIVDEMDVNKLVNKSMDWFEVDETELWNKKLPKIHRYWVETGLIDPSIAPVVDEPNIEIKFERPEPMVAYSEELKDVEKELELGTMTFKDALLKLHPEYSPEKIAELIAAHDKKKEDIKKN